MFQAPKVSTAVVHILIVSDALYNSRPVYDDCIIPPRSETISNYISLSNLSIEDIPCKLDLC